MMPLKLQTTMKNRLMTYFLLVTVFISAAIAVNNSLYFKNREKINALTLRMSILQNSLIKDFRNISDFLHHETSNPNYFETKRSTYLTQHNEIFSTLQANLIRFEDEDVIKRFEIKEALDSLFSLFLYHNTLFSEITELTYKKGFKDYGTIGIMRQNIHKLEGVKEIDQTKMLSLRRHEKDFILRHDPAYITKHKNLSSRFRNEINATYFSDKNLKDSTLKYLDNYAYFFDVMTRLDKKIGLNNQKGLKKQLIDNEANIHHLLDEILLQMDFIKKNLLERYKFINRLFTLLIVILILLTSIFISNHLTKPLHKVSESIAILAKNPSKKGYQQMNFTTGILEIDEIIKSSNHLIHEIKRREEARIQAEAILIENQVQDRELTDVLPIGI